MNFLDHCKELDDKECHGEIIKLSYENNLSLMALVSVGKLTIAIYITSSADEPVIVGFNTREEGINALNRLVEENEKVGWKVLNRTNIHDEK